MSAASAEESDPLLDRFMPAYDVAERHHVRVAAPVGITLATGSDLDLRESIVIRGIFKTRQVILGGKQAQESEGPRAFVAHAKAVGWGVLADIPGRETVFGAITQPGVPNVVFRALQPNQFATFHEPGYGKIVWTLRADPTGPLNRCSEPRRRCHHRSCCALEVPAVLVGLLPRHRFDQTDIRPACQRKS